MPAGFDAGPMQISAAIPSFVLHVGSSAEDVVAAFPAAQRKLTAIDQRSADDHDAMPSFETERELAEAKVGHESRLVRLLKPRSEGGFGCDADAPQVLAERRPLARVSRELERVRQLRQVRGHRSELSLRLQRDAHDFLLSGIPVGCTLAEVDDPPVNELLRKGERVSDAVERYRHRHRELVADAHRVKSAQWPLSVKMAEAEAQIAEWAEAAEPNFDAMIEHNADLAFPTVTSPSLVRGIDTPALTFFEHTHVLGVLSYFIPEVMLAKIRAGLAERADDANALSEEQRQIKLAEIGGDALLAERAECALIWAAEAQGELIAFRAETSPQALLGLRLVTAPRA